MTLLKQSSLQLKSRFKLENHLLLAQFIANKLGLNQLSDIKRFSDVNEGFDDNGRSYMYYNLISKSGKKISEDKLRQYDDNIKKYFQRLQKNRGDRISFKYYQYLALLFSEMYFDNYFQNPVKFLNELNQWVEESKSENYFSRHPDLQKIAYWMATGSGKTLIMHANYWQFLAYNKGPNKMDFENIILITTGDDMSKQHLAELKASGIPAVLLQNESIGYFEADKNIVKVISIHKLKLPEDKKGEGVTIDVSSRGTKNLVFVDEGHKGQKSEDMKWKKARERLARDGFTFEYSATFGQAIDGSNEESFKEYSKAILFDYSYKYFYGDGYGKDFRILNLGKKAFDDKQIKTLLLANAIAYYEQIVQYNNQRLSLKEYNIEKPLWIFVGSRVQKESGDVFKVVQFLNWLLNEDKNIAVELIDEILRGQSGIIADDKDIFSPRTPERNFAYFRERKTPAEDIYNGIFENIFYVSHDNIGHKLHLIDLKQAEGEIGLKAGTSEKYFAVINIGEKSDFLRLVEQTAQNIKVEKAILSQSLFESINETDSPINLLIGSKKFVEGWNSWRVSAMSLLYIGKGAGPQIIQLFGRGVRLKGKGMGLKRSRFLQPPHPPHIEILETLHIFGIEANHMQMFLEIIQKEDVPTYETNLLVKKIEPFPDDLQTIGLVPGWSFDQEVFKLDPTSSFEVKLDLIPRALIIDGRGDQTLTSKISQTPRVIRKQILDILDWDDIYLRILEYKNERQLFNIAITKEALKEIIYNTRCKLLCDLELIEPRSFEALYQTSEVVVLLLQKYLNQYYLSRRNAAEKKHVYLQPLKKENLIDSYRIQLSQDDELLIKKIDEFILSGKIYDSGSEYKLTGGLRSFIIKNPVSMKNAYFKGHLYQPLLVKQENSSIITVPAGLNEGESTFIDALKNYLETKTLDAEIFVLRNPPKGKGVGFYESHTFYPDFIMWIKKGRKQIIVFIDPKGLIHMDLSDPKLKLHEFLRNELQKEIGNPNIKLDAFVISVTSFTDFANAHGQHLNINELEQNKHILFQSTDAGIPNKAYVERMFDILLTS